MADTAVEAPAPVNTPKKKKQSRKPAAPVEAPEPAAVAAPPKKRGRKSAAAILAAAHVVAPAAAEAPAVPAAVPLKRRHKKKSAKRDERNMERVIRRLQKEGPMLIRATTFRRCVEAAVRVEAPDTLRQVHIRLEPASVRLLQHLCERDMGRQLGAIREVIQRAGSKTIMEKFMDTAEAVKHEFRDAK